MGVGTGVAEGLKLAGSFLTIEHLRSTWPAPYEMESAGGGDVERALSMVSLGEGLGVSARSVAQSARAGDAGARKVLARSARAFGRFLGERLVSLSRERGEILDRVVVGQRSGELLVDPPIHPWYRQPLEDALEATLHEEGDERARDAYLDDGRLAGGLVIPSTLRAAPAIGAVAEALGMLAGRRVT